MAKKKGIIRDDAHTLVVAQSRLGKTEFLKWLLKGTNRQVLFINPKRDPCGMGHLTDGNKCGTLAQLKTLLKKEKFVDYMTSFDYMDQEITKIVDGLWKSGWEGYLVIDEGWMVGRSKILGRIACAGLSQGIKMIFLTQSLAQTDDIIKTNCDVKIFFWGISAMQEQHMRRKGYPVDEIKKALKEKYQFVVYDTIELVDFATPVQRKKDIKVFAKKAKLV